MKINDLFSKLGNRHVLSLSGNFSMAVLSFITYGILFRTMSKDEAGNWVFFQSVFLLADTLRTGFIHSAIIKFCSGFPESAKKYMGAGWLIAFIISCIFILLNIFSFFLDLNNGDKVWEMIRNYIGICFLAILPLNFSTWTLQANNQFDKILIIRIMNQGSFILCIMLLAFFKLLSLQHLVYSFLASNLIASLVCIFLGWTRLDSIHSIDRKSVKEFFDYGKYSTGTVVSTNLLKSSDTFLIKHFLGAEALAIYNIPQRLLEVVEIPIRSFVMTAMPEMSKKTNESGIQAAAPVMLRYAGLLTLMLVPVAFFSVIFSKLAIWLVGGEQYIHSEAPEIFKVFILLAIFYPIDRFLGITLDIINKPRLNFIKVVVMLLVQVSGGLIALYFINSIYAVAFVSIVTFLAGVAFGHLSLRKYIRYSLVEIWYYGKEEISKLWKELILKKK